MKRILIVEDDRSLREALTAFLKVENFEVISASDGEEGFRLANQEKMDLIILDLGLPLMGGLDVCKGLREKRIMTPIIMLTGEKKEEIDKVLGLEFGADDYVTKPFGMKELLARIKAVLRRFKPEAAEIEEYSFEDVSINFKKQTAFKGKQALYLTAKELSLLKFLITHEGEVVSRNDILNEVWGYDRFPTTRTIDTFIHNLRQKIEGKPSQPAHLITVPWSGYKFQK
jgi:DNA-binding response OmpR family regulator